MIAMKELHSGSNGDISPAGAGEVNPTPSSNSGAPDPAPNARCSPRCLSLFYCCCKPPASEPGMEKKKSRNKIEPVIFQPMDDIYLQLKPHRRLRVIHMNSRGAYPTQHAYYLQTDPGNTSSTSSDEEEYWFQTADPKRPKIVQPPVKQQPKRIFHKLEPQTRPTLEDFSKSDDVLQTSIQGRLPRKTIKTEGEDEDSDDDDDDSKEKSHELTVSKINTEQSPTPSLKRNNLVINEKMLEDSTHESQIVLTLPEPGESSTDELDDNNESSDTLNNEDTNEETKNESAVTATIEEAGQKMGGRANVAFESEEFDPIIPPDAPPDEGKEQQPNHEENDDDDEEEEDDAPDTSAKVVSNGKVEHLNNHITLHTLPAIFFIHGVGGSADVWFHQLNYFTKLGHEVFAPDLLGHGFSSAPDKAKSYTFTKLLRDILTIFDHFIPRTREVIVVTHSYGSSMGAALARSRSDNVKLLVMCASGGPTPLCPPESLSRIHPSLLNCIKPLLKLKFNSRRKYKPRGRRAKIPEAFDIPAYVLHHIMMGQSWPEGDAAFHRRLLMPTLLVYGMKDPLVSLVEMCEMERTIPKAFLELIPLAGHMVMQDQPEELNKMLKKFISRYFS